MSPLRLLLVDDEAPARHRLRELLSDIAGELPTEVVGEAANGLTALECLQAQAADVVLADIRMPGMDGLELAAHLAGLAHPPALIFTTAYDNHAVQAFELNALDYLLKPVRAQRLLAALQKQARLPAPEALASLGQAVRGSGRSHLASHERGRLTLVPVRDILFFRADMKYVAAHTAEREFLLEESLSHLESEFADRFIRLHRSVLVARDALAGLERGAGDDAEAYGWAVLRGVSDKLPVSRRQWGPVRALLMSSENA